MKTSLFRVLPVFVLATLGLQANAALDKAWDAPFINGANQTICYDVATEAGNTYSAGFVQTTNNFGYLIAHDADGAEIWERAISTPCILNKIVVATSHVYACGYTPANGFDGVVVKLDKATGAPSATWADTGFGVGVRHFGNSQEQSFSAMVVTGNLVYLAGYYGVASGNLDVCLVKLDASGALSNTWNSTGLGVGVRTLAGTGGGVDLASDLVIDVSGNLYATGKLRTTGLHDDGFVWKVVGSNGTSSGTWPTTGDGVGVRRFTSGFANGADGGNALALRGSVVTVAGYLNGDGVVAQYSATGVLNWVFTHGGTNTQSFHDIAAHPDGYYAIGPDDDEGVIVNIDEVGDAGRWHGNGGTGVNNFDNDGNNRYRVVVDPFTGKPYFAGYGYDVNSDREIVLYTVNSSTPAIVGKADTVSTDNCNGLAIDPSGRISVVGTAYTSPASGLIARFGLAADYSALEYVVTEGFEFDGGLGQLLTSNDQYFQLFNDDATGGAAIEFMTYLPADQRNPFKLIVQYESAVGRPGLVETFQVKNYTLNLMQTRLGAVASTFDTARMSTNSTTPERDINDSDGQVKIRLAWRPLNDEDPSQDGWLHRMDYLNWRVVY